MGAKKYFPNVATGLLIGLFTHGLAFADNFDRCGALGDAVSTKKQLTSPIPPDWDTAHFSDPREHDESKFVYLVTSISTSLDELRERHLGFILGEVWASIVSNDAPFVRDNASGLILEVKPDNVVANSCYDKGWSYGYPGQISPSPHFLEYQAHNPRVLNPSQMLRASAWSGVLSLESMRTLLPELLEMYSNVGVPDSYRNNEILLRTLGPIPTAPGPFTGHLVSSIGVYLSSKDYSSDRIDGLKDFAKKYSLPIIRLP